MHTWLYLAAGKIFWLAYDVWVAIEKRAGFTPGLDAGVEQILRVLAILFVFAATVAQRRSP